MLPKALGLALALAPLALLAPTPVHAVSIVDFEDVGALLPPESFDDATGGFTSGGASFPNESSGCCWNGWLYSNTTDTTTPGFENDFSAFAGSGAGGSATYGVAFLFGEAAISFASEVTLVSGAFTNTTYAALSMLNGDGFAKQFGGESGDDPDFLRLDIEGFDALGASTGVVELYLADYRFADGADDYVLDVWTTVDLSPLGAVETLDFSLAGSDVGEFGLNTPNYFALDDLVFVPEPGTGLLLGLGLVGLAAGRRP